MFGVEGFAISWITARFAAERTRALAATAEAREGEKKLDAVLAALDHGVTVQALDGRIVYANQAAARMIGFETPDQVTSADPAKIMSRFEMRDEHGDPLEPDVLPGRRVRQGLPGGEVLVQFTSRGGVDARWSLVGASPIRDERGELAQVVNVFKDVTESRRQQEALDVSREWFSTALRSIGDAVIATDASGRVTFVNPVAEQLTGWSAGAAEGKPLDEVFRIIAEDTREVTESPVERVLREGAVVGLANHTILVRRDGSEVAIDDSAAPIRRPDGELVGVVLVFRDVSVARRIGASSSHGRASSSRPRWTTTGRSRPWRSSRCRRSRTGVPSTSWKTAPCAAWPWPTSIRIESRTSRTSSGATRPIRTRRAESRTCCGPASRR